MEDFDSLNEQTVVENDQKAMTAVVEIDKDETQTTCQVDCNDGPVRKATTLLPPIGASIVFSLWGLTI